MSHIENAPSNKKLLNIPTNLIMGFLGVGKTTAILNLLEQKPENEVWAVLVNEYGKVGIDGALFASYGAVVKEIAGGCLCCVLGVPFQTGLNQLLKEARPDRLLIEPSGLGHPKKVLKILTEGSFKKVLDVRASICLVDPEKLKDGRYTSHESFVDQIALSDVLVANKTDKASLSAMDLFYQWSQESNPLKAMVAKTTQGKLNVDWLDLKRNSFRVAHFQHAHPNPDEKILHSQKNSLDTYQTFGFVYSKECCFDLNKITSLLNKVSVERLKAVLNTSQGWFVFNKVEGELEVSPLKTSKDSRIELILKQNPPFDLAVLLENCQI